MDKLTNVAVKARKCSQRQLRTLIEKCSKPWLDGGGQGEPRSNCSIEKCHNSRQRVLQKDPVHSPSYRLSC